MNPKTKILLASALLLALGAAASVGGISPALLARVTLGTAAAAGLAWWLLFVRGRRAGPEMKPRLQIIARAGLSPRSALALIEIDGRPLLVVHGDGFAELHAPPRAPRRRSQARRASFEQALRSVP